MSASSAVRRAGARAASPAPAPGAKVDALRGVVAEADGAAVAARTSGSDKAVATPGRIAAGAADTYVVAAWIALLCITQLAMFIFAKRAMQQARLPFFLCLVQFALSAAGAAVPSPLTGGGWRTLKLMGREHGRYLLPLALLWTVAFLLLNASVALMAASLAGTVRALEPVFAVTLGFAIFQERYSLLLVATLLPICAGAVLASPRGSGGSSNISLLGVMLAALSNFGFAARPYLAQRLAAQKCSVKLDSASVFFNAMCIGLVTVIAATLLLEGRAALEAFSALRGSGGLGAFARDVLLSGMGFFVYQFSQMVLMTRMSSIAFSIVTPMSKAFVIITCAVYFTEGLGVTNLAGIVISTVGVLCFSCVRRADMAVASGKPAAKAKQS